MVIKNVGYEALKNRNRMEKAKLIFNDNGQFIFKGPVIVLRRGWLVTRVRRRVLADACRNAMGWYDCSHASVKAEVYLEVLSVYASLSG